MNDKDRAKTVARLEARVKRLKAKKVEDPVKARRVRKSLKRAQRRRRALAPPPAKKAD